MIKEHPEDKAVMPESPPVIKIAGEDFFGVCSVLKPAPQNIPARNSLPKPESVQAKTILVVALALIDADGRILLAQRPEGRDMAGLWEFPGGKVKADETPEAALRREITEELGLDICHACLAPLSFVSHSYPHFHLLMPLYVCRNWDGIPQGLEGQKLAWVTPDRLNDYPMPPADIPLIHILQEYLT